MTQQVFFARMRENIDPGFLPFALQAGEELPIDPGETLLRPETEYVLMKRDCIGIYSFGVERSKCTIFTRLVMSRFVLGDIVRDAKSGCIFRIYATKWDKVDFWHQNGWGESQGFKAGAYDDDLHLATEIEIESNRASIQYYDELMARRSKLFQQAVGI